MASPTGGQFVFAVDQAGKIVPAGLSINNGSGIFPPPSSTAPINIEVFTALSGTTVPAPDTGFNAAALDHGGTLVNNFLTGTHLILGGGNYIVTDSVTGAAAQSAAEIDLGTGNQEVVAAPHDTLVGGAGNQILDARAGNVAVAGGSGTDSIWGGANDSIYGGTGTGTQIVVTGSGASVLGGASGSETISLAAGDTMLATVGGAALGVAAGANDKIDLTGNTGNSFVTGASGDSIAAGGGTTAIDATAAA